MPAQKVQNLEKIEQYLKQQVSDLEVDRQELYDLLREDKRIIHDLKIKVRTLELSEELLNERLNQMSEEESRLILENDNLTNRIHELEFSLSLQAPKKGVDKSQITDPYEPDELKNLKSELAEKDLQYKNLGRKVKNLEDEKNHKYTDTQDLVPKDEPTKELVPPSYANEKELKILPNEVESQRNAPRLPDALSAAVQTEMAEKRASTQTEESVFEDGGRIAKGCQTDEVEVHEKRMCRSRSMQVEDFDVLTRNREVQTEDDGREGEMMTLKRELLLKKDEIKFSEDDKKKYEEELSRLRGLLQNTKSHLDSTEQERGNAVEKLRSTETNLLATESNRDEKAAALLNKILEITNLKKDITDKDEEMKMLWTDMKKIQENYSDYIETSGKEMAVLENKSKDLMQEIKNKAVELEKSNKEHEITTDKLRKTEEEFLSRTEDKDQILAELTASKENLKNKDDEVKKLLEDLNGFQARYDALVKDHENCLKTDTDWKKNVDSYKNDLKTLKEKNLDLSKQVESKESRLGILIPANADLEEKLKSSEDRNMELQESIKKMELRNELLNSTSEQRMRLITNAMLKHQAEKKSDDTAATSQISFFKKSLQSKDEEIQLLTNDINELHKKYLDLLQKSTKDLAESGDETRISDRRAAELSRRNEEIHTLMDNEEKLQKKIIDLLELRQQEKDNFETDKNKLARDLKDLEGKGRKLEQVTRELHDAKTELTESERKFDDMRSKLFQATNALKSSAQHNKELLMHQNSAKHVGREKEQLERQLEEVQKKHLDEISVLERKLENALKDKKGLEAMLENLRHQLTKLEGDNARRRQMEQQLNDLQISHQGKDKQLHTLLEKVNSMKDEINGLLNEKRRHVQRERYYAGLQKEHDQLKVNCQRQSRDIQILLAKDGDLSAKVKEKDNEIKELNSELSDCMELSRKLTILNFSR